MRLRHIEIFHAVMLTGTVNGAAQLLNISQPAVTKMLQHAELQLGFKLFVRSKGRLVPTSEANVLFVEASKIFSGLDNLRSIASNLRNSCGDRIRIAVPPAFCLGLIPEAIAAFRAEIPEMVFEVHSHHYSEAISAVLRQDVDLAIVFNPREHPALIIEQLATAYFLACFPPKSEPTVPPSVNLSDLRQWPFIALSGRDPLGTGIHTALQLADVTLANSLEVNTNALALALVQRGAGAAVIDEYTAAALGAGVCVRQLDPPLTFEVGIITLANATSSNGVKQLRRVLHAVHASHRVASVQSHQTTTAVPRRVMRG